MKFTLAIQRFNPETDSEPHVQNYQVEVEPTHRVLDALMDITQNQDGTLGYRRSCAHGVCGSDAMRINGREKLACKTLGWFGTVPYSMFSLFCVMTLEGWPGHMQLAVQLAV